MSAAPFAGILLVLSLLVALLLAVKALQRRASLRPETARKCVHLGMGTVCLGLPWLFREAWPVWILAGTALILLGGIRAVPALRRGIGSVLHDVNRPSLGELCFPVGVALVFTLAQGEFLPFVIPVALLAYADAAGAIIGTRWGRHRFATLEDSKSIEGSIGVGVAGLLASAVPLLLAGQGWPAALLMGGAIGLFALNLEAVSSHGLDNLFLPLAAFAQVSAYLDTPTTVLAANLSVLFVLTTLALLWRRGQAVDESARLGCALALYFFWSVGGPAWLLAPLILVGSYVRPIPRVHPGAPRHTLVAVLSVGSAGLIWAVADVFSPHPAWFALFTLGTATHHAMIGSVRFAQARPAWSPVAWWAAGVAQSVVPQGLAFALLLRDDADLIRTLAIGAGCVAAATGVFVIGEPRPSAPERPVRRWWRQGLAAALASGGGWLLSGL